MEEELVVVEEEEEEEERKRRKTARERTRVTSRDERAGASVYILPSLSLSLSLRVRARYFQKRDAAVNWRFLR